MISEKIKDSFWYVENVDFKIVIDRNTGYFNATKLCIRSNKLYKTWFQNKKTKELFEIFESQYHNDNGSSYEIQGENNNDDLTKQYTGVYIHPDLLLNVGMWISTRCYFKCLDILKNQNFKIEEKSIKNPLKDLENKIVEQNNKLIHNLEYIKQKLDNISKLSQYKNPNNNNIKCIFRKRFKTLIQWIFRKRFKKIN